MTYLIGAKKLGLWSTALAFGAGAALALGVTFAVQAQPKSPMGLAAGRQPSVDLRGQIWKAAYQTPASAPPAAASASQAPAGAEPGLPTPPGATAEQVANGMRIFKGAICAACHGQDASGGAIGPNLTTGSPLWTDGSLASITDLITKGVPAPKQSRSSMPPMGGVQLSPDDLAAVAAYVWAVGHQKQGQQ